MNFKKLFAAACVSASISSGFSYDWGGLLCSDSKVKTDADHDFFFNQKNIASLWIRVPTSKDSQNYFIAETTYQFDGDLKSNEASNYIDLNLFKAVFTKEEGDKKYELNLGRFAMSDLTGIIYIQNADGISFKYSGAGCYVSAYGAYTGFLNGNVVKEINAKDFAGCDADKLYDFADKYLIGNLAITLPNLFANQTLSAQALGTFRTVNTRLNRIYASLDLAGPLAAQIFYKLGTSIGLTYWDDKSPKVGNLTTATMTIFPAHFVSFSINGVFASDGFWGFTHNPSLMSYNEPEYHNLLKVGMSTIIKPHRTVMVFGQVDTAFGIGEDDDVDFTSKGNDNHPGDSRSGLQYKVGATWQPFIDLSLNANFSQYYDFGDTDIGKTVIQIQVTLTF